jgi:hypothetical protein
MDKKRMARKTKMEIGKPEKPMTRSEPAGTASDTTVSNESPLDYMLRVMRDPTQEDKRRDDMAKTALPYVHARRSLASGPTPNEDDGPVSFTWQPPQK